MLKILPRKKSSQRISSDQNHQEVSILPNYNYDNNLEDNINQFSTNLHNDNYDDNEFVNSDDHKISDEHDDDDSGDDDISIIGSSEEEKDFNVYYQFIDWLANL